jgi:prolyl 4-hydroxylase
MDYLTGGLSLADVVCPLAHLPTGCKLHTEDGGEITNCGDIVSNGTSVVAVHPERFFVYGGVRRGFTRTLHRLVNDDNVSIQLETVNLAPRIFRVKNLFTEAEANQLVANALAFTGEAGLRRSVTGPSTFASVNRHRTSSNVFDTHSEVALNLQKRAFDLLGIFPFDEKMVDGLQA